MNLNSQHAEKIKTIKYRRISGPFNNLFNCCINVLSLVKTNSKCYQIFWLFLQILQISVILFQDNSHKLGSWFTCTINKSLKGGFLSKSWYSVKIHMQTCEFLTKKGPRPPPLTLYLTGFAP